ncbi:MAG: S41 family peptidase [Rickettsiales bacterium]|jgi:carboxyl-terminal processing protease|nr:S41 family peptidase [Rickettsiales bacterium]
MKKNNFGGSSPWKGVVLCLWGVLVGYRVLTNADWLAVDKHIKSARVVDNPVMAATRSDGLVNGETPEENRELFDYVVGTILNNYVEDVDRKKLYESAFSGILSSLDPHSGYMTEREFAELSLHTSGEFGGLGIVVTKDSGYVKVISPIYDTPAERAGIKSGDFISEIDDRVTYNMSLGEAVDNMRGKPGTRVKLTVLRVGETKPLTFDLKREIIKTNSIKGRIENKNIIYIRITNFTKSTYRDLIDTYNRLRNSIDGKVPRGVIVDLRNNPGGLLDQAIKVCELFLEKDRVIVSTRGRNNRSLEVHKSGAEKVLINVYPIVVLVNEGSASASEIVAGALQDHKRAIVMGTKTFGKASVQAVFPLKNRGAIKMTVAKYYTPNNRSLQADGVEPDIWVEEGVVNFVTDGDKIRETDLPGHLKREDGSDGGGKKENAKEDIVSKSIRENEQNRSRQKGNIKDYQLSKAIDLIIGIDFYGRK